MSNAQEILKSLSVLNPGTYEFTVKEILDFESGEEYGDSVYFRTTDGKVIVLSESELYKNNKIVSRFDVKEGMKLKKVVKKGNLSHMGRMSQTS